ncbi:MAG: PEP-CTERM sorting domain-containing protein, partial [Myxococcota bacterium]
ISVIGAPYTVKTVSAVNRTANAGFQVFQESGFAHGPLSTTSSTAQASGVLQMVTANHITVVGPGDGDLSGTVSRLLVHFIPEPGLLLLFGSGAVGMALLGRKRIRK